MKTFMRLFVPLALCLLLIETARLHVHLHVIECDVHGFITDSDGVSKWKDCAPVKR